MITTEEEWNRAFELTLPLVSAGIGVLAITIMAFRSQLARRVLYEDGQYFVSVRFPGQHHELRDFVQPDNPDILAVYSQKGPDPWALYNFVCQEISYRHDVGEFWQTPSETLARGYGDCEDTSVLLTSLIRAGGTPNCYVVLGSLRGYGHAWCQLNGQILETTYVQAMPAPDPEDYCPYVLFSDQEVIELWHGALEEVFNIRRNEALKLKLIAEVINHGTL
ncbi:hypothetical protein ES703_106952 [subsurface metagenome]